MEKYVLLSSISQRFPQFRELLSEMSYSSDDVEPIDHLAVSFGAASGYLKSLLDFEEISDFCFDRAKQELIDFHDSILSDL